MNMHPKLFCFLLVLITIISCNRVDADYPNSELLIEAEDLSELLFSEGVLVIDMREEGFDDGHIPGAVWFGGAPALVDTSHAVDHFLIDSSAFQSLMRTIGLNNDTHVIIYDGGNSLAAARLFFALELNGHPHARVLNGGFQAWMESELETSTISDVPQRGNFTSRYNDAATCDVTYIVGALDRDDVVILDARSPEEYSGEEERSRRSGHIPNAVNLEWRNFIESEGVPYFKTYEDITELLASKGITPDKEVVTHCQSNVRGAHAYFTLRLMGYDEVRAYEGSWAEWGNMDDTPIQN